MTNHFAEIAIGVKKPDGRATWSADRMTLARWNHAELRNVGGKAQAALGIVLGTVIVALPAGLALRNQRPPHVGQLDPGQAESPTERPSTGASSHPPQPDPAVANPVNATRIPEPTNVVPKEPAPETVTPADSPEPVPSGKPARRPPPPGEESTTGDTETESVRASSSGQPYPPGLPKVMATPPDASAMTALSGRHLTGLTLRKSKSPYVLTGRTEILGSLDIEPGVAVWLLPEKTPSAKLIVQGTVRAEGLADQPILFAAQQRQTNSPFPVILESPSVSQPGTPEGWQMRYSGISNCSFIGTMRGGQSVLHFCRVNGEFRLESQQGAVSVADSSFEASNDLILSAPEVTLERIVAASPEEESVSKQFVIVSGERVKVSDSRFRAEFLRVLNRPGASQAMFMQGNTFFSRQMTIQLAGNVELRAAQNSFYLYYRLQVVGMPSDHPSGVNLGKNYWEIRASDEKWPYQPKCVGEEEILTVLDRPRLERPVGRYLWGSPASGPPARNTP